MSFELIEQEEPDERDQWVRHVGRKGIFFYFNKEVSGIRNIVISRLRDLNGTNQNVL